jgi:hypothetical protein
MAPFIFSRTVRILETPVNFLALVRQIVVFEIASSLSFFFSYLFIQSCNRSMVNPTGSVSILFPTKISLCFFVSISFKISGVRDPSKLLISHTKIIMLLG